MFFQEENEIYDVIKRNDEPENVMPYLSRITGPGFASSRRKQFLSTLSKAIKVPIKKDKLPEECVTVVCFVNFIQI